MQFRVTPAVNVIDILQRKKLEQCTRTRARTRAHTYTHISISISPPSSLIVTR